MFEVHISKHSLFRLKITVGCLTSTYPSIHFSLDEDTLKIMVGCLTSAYPSVHKNSQDHGRLPDKCISKHSRWNSEDHGRLPVEHISKQSQQKLAHVRAVGTSTRADACACAFTGDPQPRWFELTLLWQFRALRRNHLVSTLFWGLCKRKKRNFLLQEYFRREIYFHYSFKLIPKNRRRVKLQELQF